MMWMIIAMLLVPLAFGEVSLSVGGDCTLLKPGESKVYILTYTPTGSGDRILQITSDGLAVSPSEITVKNAQEGAKYLYYVRVTAPGNVVDSFYTLKVTEYDALTNDVLSAKEYCFRVYRGISYEGAPQVVVGYESVYTTNDAVVVEVFVKNLGSYTETVYLNSDYANMYFERNPVVVYPYKTARVKAYIPIEEVAALPDYVKLFATVGDVTKEVVVQMPRALINRVELDVRAPREIVVNTAISYVPVLVANNSDVPVKVMVVGKEMPMGVSLRSDVYKVLPGSQVRIEAIMKTGRVFDVGAFVSKICVTDEFGTELECKSVVITIPEEKEKVSVVEEEAGDEKVVTVTVEAGTDYVPRAKVEVEAPEGWSVEVFPETFDLEPYTREVVTVKFKAVDGASEGIATIRITDEEGNVIAQRTITLRSPGLTGFFLGGASSLAALVLVAAIILAVAAYVNRRRKTGKAEGDEEEIKELLSKE